MKTKKKKLRIFFILLTTLIAVVLIFFFGNQKEKIKHQPRPSGVAQTTKPAKAVQMKKITLFFLSENDNLLHPEEREIQASSINEEAKEVVEELIKGPKSGLLASIPENTRVRQVFVTSDGVAYVDLSRAVIEATYYGSTGEMAVVYSIVNSLAYNFKAIKKVSLLVEGNERETLGGHIDLSQPFFPDYSLVAK